MFVLVVTRQAAISELARQALGAEGWWVTAVADRETAVRYASDQAPRLVLVDGGIDEADEAVDFFARRSGGPGVVLLLPEGADGGTGGDHMADATLAHEPPADVLLEAARRLLDRPQPPANGLPTPGQVLNSQDIFGDMLLEMEGGVGTAPPAPAPVVSPAAAEELEAELPAPPPFLVDEGLEPTAAAGASLDPPPADGPEPAATEAEPPTAEAEPSPAEPEPPTTEAEPATAEPEPPTAAPEALADEPEPPADEPEAPVGEPELPADEPEPPVGEDQGLVPETVGESATPIDDPLAVTATLTNPEVPEAPEPEATEAAEVEEPQTVPVAVAEPPAAARRPVGQRLATWWARRRGAEPLVSAAADGRGEPAESSDGGEADAPVVSVAAFPRRRSRWSGGARFWLGMVTGLLVFVAASFLLDRFFPSPPEPPAATVPAPVGEAVDLKELVDREMAEREAELRESLLEEERRLQEELDELTRKDE